MVYSSTVRNAMPTISVDAEYDGRVLIPHQPLNLPIGKRVRLIITDESIETKVVLLEAMLDYFRSRPVRRSLTDEELRREVIYED